MSVEVASDAARRAAHARARADARLRATVGDLFLPDDARLGERSRLAAARLLSGMIDGIENDLRRQVARLLTAREPGRGSADPSLSAIDAGERLIGAGQLRDEALVDALVMHVRHREIADALPVSVGESEGASLLVRLGAVPDRVVAAAARALLAADSADAPGLSVRLQERIVWAVAAAIRPAADDPAVDLAIAEGARRALAARRADEGLGAVAMRLAVAIDARPEELAPLLIEALGDRRLALFMAVLAHAAGLDFDRAQAMVLEVEGERLWLALRAIGLDRKAIARIALALSDADPRRDIEAFADRLDAIAAVDPAVARHAIAAETLPPAFRASIRALRRAEAP